MTAPRSTDELLFHWPRVASIATNQWAKDFAGSIAKQSRRRGWQPSQKQAALMQRMVCELFSHADQEGDDFALIE